MKRFVLKGNALLAAFVMLSFSMGGGSILTSCDTIYEPDEREWVRPEEEDSGDGEDPAPLEPAGYGDLAFTLSSAPAGFTIGATADMTVSISLPDDKSLPPVTFVWESSDEAVFTVSGDNATAVITGTGAGSADLTVFCEEYPDLKASAEVSVIDGENPYPYMTLALAPESLTGIESGTSVELSAVVGNVPEGSDVPVDIVWQSSDESVFSLGATETKYEGAPMKNTLVANSPGQATLTVTCRQHAGLSVTMDVQVLPAGDARYNRVYVDFGSAKPVADSRWNNYTELDTALELKDEKGNVSGISVLAEGLTFYGPGTPAGDFPEYNGITVPSDVMTDAVQVYNKVASGTVTVSGLDPSMTYTFTTLSCRPGGSYMARHTKISVEGAQTYEDDVYTGLKFGTDVYPDGTCIATGWDTFDDPSPYFCDFTLSPDADGTVVITLTSVETGSARDAHLNALVITPVQ